MNIAVHCSLTWKFILMLHFNLQPFDLKEIDIMVSFPDNYPQEVKTAASS